MRQIRWMTRKKNHLDMIPWNTLNFPTGQLIIADDLRDTFDIELDRSKERDINLVAGRLRWTQHYANLGVASANIGNSNPQIYREKATGNLMIAEISIPCEIFDFNNPPIDENDDTAKTIYIHADGLVATQDEVSNEQYTWEIDLYDEVVTPVKWEQLGRVNTRLWAYMLTDKSTYLAAGGKEETLEKINATVVSIQPGRYHFITYVNHPDFKWNDTYIVYAEAIFEAYTENTKRD